MSLVEAWRMDEASGTRVGQLGAGCDLAVISGAPGSTAGKISNAVSGSSWTIGKTASGIGSLAALRSGNFTIAYWVRRDASTYSLAITLKKASTSAGIYVNEQNSSTPSVSAFGTGSVSSFYGQLTQSVWTFRALSWNLASKTLTVYDDILGSVIQKDSDVGSGVSYPADFDNFTIAGANVTLDQLMIYNELLTPTTGTNTLNQLWNSGAGFDPTVPVVASASPSLGIPSRFEKRNRFSPWAR